MMSLEELRKVKYGDSYDCPVCGQYTFELETMTFAPYAAGKTNSCSLPTRTKKTVLTT